MVFIQGIPATEAEKKEMLKAYSLAWLWATDTVLEKLNFFIDLQIKRRKNPTLVSQKELKESYGECILEMRKDSGYPDTKQKVEDYRFISIN